MAGVNKEEKERVPYIQLQVCSLAQRGPRPLSWVLCSPAVATLNMHLNQISCPIQKDKYILPVSAMSGLKNLNLRKSHSSLYFFFFFLLDLVKVVHMNCSGFDLTQR